MLSIASIETEHLFLLGDVHGRFDLVRRVLDHAGLRDGIPAGASFVQVGDLVDRGRESERSALRSPALPLPSPGARICAHPPDGSTWRLADVLDRTIPGTALRAADERSCLLGALDILQTVRDAIKFEARSVGRAFFLLGNHDLDLLRGRFLYARRQKEYLCTLLGLSPEQVARHANEGLPLAVVAKASDEMAWLARRPLIATGHGVAAIHGGPTRALVETFAAFGAGARDRIDHWLTQARRTNRHVAFDEGASLLSPDRPDDDFVCDEALRQGFLTSMAADTLAIGHSAFLHAAHVERPVFLAGRAILKLDTDVKRGGPMWLVERRDGRWTAISSEGERRPVTLAGDAPHCPPAAEIETRIFAVHGTNRFPRHGVVAAGSDLPAHFRPGAHFSLGGLSNGMDARCRYRFGVVAPLGCLADQLLSVGPTDSFVLGDVPLSRQTTIVLPDGQSTGDLPPDIPVVFYPPEKGLRRAIDDVIRDARGWDIVLPDSLEIGHVARIERRDIATPAFFERFLASRPHIAFGGHAGSEVGEAALFGMTDRLVQGLSRPYRSPLAPPLGTAKLAFILAVIGYLLARIDAAYRSTWAASCLIALDQAIATARPWISLGKRDVALRRSHGKTLVGSGVDAVLALDTDAIPDRLLSSERINGLGAYIPPQHDAIEDAFAGEVLSILDFGELGTLAGRGIAIPIDRTSFRLEYAVARWLTLGTARARREALDRLFVDAADRPVADSRLVTAPLWLARLHHHLSFDSNKKRDAETILQHPSCRDLIDRCHLAKLPLSTVQELSVVFKNHGTC